MWYYKGANSAIIHDLLNKMISRQRKLLLPNPLLPNQDVVQKIGVLKLYGEQLIFSCMLMYIYAIFHREGVFCLYKQMHQIQGVILLSLYLLMDF